VLSLTGPPREPAGPGAPAGPVSPCKEQKWLPGLLLLPRNQPARLLLTVPHSATKDALPYLQVGQQDQEDQWDLRYPKIIKKSRGTHSHVHSTFLIYVCIYTYIYIYIHTHTYIYIYSFFVCIYRYILFIYRERNYYVSKMTVINLINIIYISV